MRTLLSIGTNLIIYPINNLVNNYFVQLLSISLYSFLREIKGHAFLQIKTIFQRSKPRKCKSNKMYYNFLNIVVDSEMTMINILFGKWNNGIDYDSPIHASKHICWLVDESVRKYRVGQDNYPSKVKVNSLWTSYFSIYLSACLWSSRLY